MIKFIKYTVREFLGLDNDYESLLTNQDKIMEQIGQVGEQLKELEVENKEALLEQKNDSYMQYLTLKNILWAVAFVGIIGSGIWLYNADFLNSNILDSIKDLGSLSKDLHSIDHKGVLDALKQLNENTANLSKEEIKLLMEIKNLLLKKGIDENQSPVLDRPINELSGTIEWGSFRD